MDSKWTASSRQSTEWHHASELLQLLQLIHASARPARFRCHAISGNYIDGSGAELWPAVHWAGYQPRWCDACWLGCWCWWLKPYFVAPDSVPLQLSRRPRPVQPRTVEWLYLRRLCRASSNRYHISCRWVRLSDTPRYRWRCCQRGTACIQGDSIRHRHTSSTTTHELLTRISSSWRYSEQQKMMWFYTSVNVTTAHQRSRMIVVYAH